MYSSSPCGIYAALGIIHARGSRWRGGSRTTSRCRKFNLYQSLHTTVIGPYKPVEIQIRTYQMHRRAQYGVAAHWKYKEYRGGGARQGAGRGTDLPAWWRQIVVLQRETLGPGSSLQALRFETSGARGLRLHPEG